jgi:UDP-2-acetamido-2,6-beta-L-arabino-hexul-4-ose reductase
MKILVLGSTGFIGKNLMDRLSQESGLDVLTVNRDFVFNGTNEALTKGVNGLLESLEGHICVINLSGAAGEGDSVRLRSANIEFPLSILRLIQGTVSNIQWLQASSFFQLYRVLYGKHKDLYSETKDEFLDLLRRELGHERLQNLYLPHVFGRYDRPTRLISSLVIAKRERRGIDLSSGRAVMPLLRVDELVDAMVGFVKNRWASQRQPLPENQLLGSGVFTVREIVELMLGEDVDLAKFDQLPDRPFEFYSKLDLLSLCNRSTPSTIDWTSYLTV